MTEIQSSVVACPILGASENDEVFYWDTVRFSVQGCIFKIPKYHFTQGSEYFATKYLSAVDVDDEAAGPPIILEDITAPQFRTFLRALYPMHTTSISTTFTWSEWHTILTLSTLWHFNYLRKLAITHLEPYHSEPIELVKAGRAAFVPSWVLAGYKKLVTKPDAISEKESGAIGHLTVVRLYIIRHSLQQAKGRPELCDGSDPLRPSVGDILLEKFKDQFGILRVEELARRTKEEIERDELITAEAEQVKKKEQEQEQEQEEKGRQRKEKSEERRRCVEMMRLEEDEKMRLEVMRRHTEEDEAVRLEAVKRRIEEDKMMLLEQKDRSPQEIKNMQLEVEIQRAIEDKRSQFEQEKRRAEEHEKMRVEVEKRRGEEDEEMRLEVEKQLEEEDQRTRLGTKRAAKRERMERIRARRVVELELAC